MGHRSSMRAPNHSRAGAGKMVRSASRDSLTRRRFDPVAGIRMNPAARVPGLRSRSTLASNRPSSGGGRVTGSQTRTTAESFPRRRIVSISRSPWPSRIVVRADQPPERATSATMAWQRSCRSRSVSLASTMSMSSRIPSAAATAANVSTANAPPPPSSIRLMTGWDTPARRPMVRCERPRARRAARSRRPRRGAGSSFRAMAGCCHTALTPDVSRDRRMASFHPGIASATAIPPENDATASQRGTPAPRASVAARKRRRSLASPRASVAARSRRRAAA